MSREMMKDNRMSNSRRGGTPLYAAMGEWLYRHGARLEARLYGLRTERITVDELPITLYRGGMSANGRKVLLLHGFTADRQVWPRFARHLLRQYDVIIPDLPGHGDTGFVPGLGYSAARQAERMVRLLDALGIERAHVIGNSMGGFIAARMGHSYADRLRSLVLIAPAGVTSPDPSDLDKMLAAGTNPFEVKVPQDFHRLYPMTMAKPPRLPRIVLAAIAEHYRQQRSAFMEIFADFKDHDALDAELGHIAPPTLVMWGAHDRLLHVTAADKWAAGIPNARKNVYQDLGHMPMVEAPARAAGEILAFLEEQDRKDES